MITKQVLFKKRKPGLDHKFGQTNECMFLNGKAYTHDFTARGVFHQWIVQGIDKSDLYAIIEDEDGKCDVYAAELVKFEKF